MTTTKDDDSRKPLTFAQAAEKHRGASTPSDRRERIIRKARELLAGPAWTVTDEGLASQMSDLIRPGQQWSEFVREVRAALKGGGLLKGDAVGGAGEVAYEATHPAKAAEKAALSLAAPGAAMREARRQAVVAEVWRGTARENAALRARGTDANLALGSTGYSGGYKGTDAAPIERQAAAVAEMPPERRDAVAKELMKNTGMLTGGFLPAEEEEARDLIARAGSVMRGRELPRLAALVRDAAAVIEGKKVKSENLLDRLRAEVEEAEWKRKGWSA